MNLWHWIKCRCGRHEEWSFAKDHNYRAPPRDHPLHPSNASTLSVSESFQEWTRLRCRHCNWTYLK